MTPLYKVLIFGSRDWSDSGRIEYELIKLIARHGKNRLLIIQGGAPGADTTAGILAHRRSVHVARVDALWDTRYRSAGPQRNEIMALLAPDEGIGFHEDIKKSKGTKDMAKRLERHNIPYRIVSS